jgi:hypothetical protein
MVDQMLARNGCRERHPRVRARGDQAPRAAVEGLITQTSKYHISPAARRDGLQGKLLGRPL